jgi:hypothetical protein
MKVRLDFVTNSSSSSYICDVSGSVESGWDLSLEDAQMYQCENSHTFCDDYLIGDLEKATYEEVHSRLVKLINSYEGRDNNDYAMRFLKDNRRALASLEENKDDEDAVQEIAESNLEWGDRYSVPSSHCPICTMNNLSDSDALKYFLKVSRITKEQVLSGVRDRFGTYTEFKDFIRS